MPELTDTVMVGGIAFHAATEAEVVWHVLTALDRGAGGRILTPNVDIVRLVAAGEDGVDKHLADADLVVADGTPLLWASRLAGRPLPERVAGSSLIWTLSAALGAAGRSAYLLGGAPAHGVPGQRCDVDTARTVPSGRPAEGAPGLDGAERAADVLAAHCTGLRIAGAHSPTYGFDADPATLRAELDRVVAAAPDVVFVGLGFPRQERVIDRLRPDLPDTWFLGCGAAIAFVAGERRRAPQWMQTRGLEWLHRLGSEPRRLARRYVVDDLPYAARLLAGATASRWSHPTPTGGAHRRAAR